MNCYLQEYVGYKYKLAVYTDCPDDLDETAINGEEHVSFANHYLIFSSGARLYVSREQTKAFFLQRTYGDVLEFLPNGVVNLLYDVSAEDNLLFVTPRCSSNCIMCPSSETSRRETAQTEEQLLYFVSLLPDRLSHITVSGGEPFMLGENLLNILDALKEHDKNAGVLLLSNGRAFCLPEIAKKFSRCAPDSTIVGIPIHGYSALTHDNITQSPGSFAQTIQGIHNLLAHKCHVEIRIVVSKLNYTFINEITDFLINEFRGLLRVIFIGLEMTGNAALNNKDVWIPYTTSFNSIKDSIIRLINSNVTVSLYNYPLCTVDSAFWPICAKSITDYKISFSDSCGKCTIYDSCGGVFKSSLHYAKDELKPFVQGE
ncbi:MAG: His-Xaa-Ser system radical SAM maturase HxsC [Oscillospiraceae bacterium]|nr:His-Xaa-Ser system radical SAM maturase HxsC [Oscillospiraceae bacterium]